MDNRYFHYFYKENFIKEVDREIKEEQKKNDPNNDNSSIPDISLEDFSNALEDMQ